MHFKPRSWLFLAVGAILTGIEVYGCMEYLYGQQGHWSYIVALGGAVTACAALLPMATEMSLRDARYILAFLATVAIAPALTTIFLAAIERTGSARDVIVRQIADHKTAQDSARKRLTDAEAALANTPSTSARITAAEAAKATADAAVLAKSAERGCLENCRKLLQAQVDGAAEEVTRARAELSTLWHQQQDEVRAARLALEKLGSPPFDPQARRIAAMLPISEESVQLYAPLVLPLTGSLLGIIFIAIGGRLETAEQPAPQIPAVAVIEPVRETSTAVALVPRKLDPKPVVALLTSSVPEAAGERASWADILIAYRRQREALNGPDYSTEEFGRILRVIGQKAGMRIEIDGDHVFFVGRRVV